MRSTTSAILLLWAAILALSACSDAPDTKAPQLTCANSDDVAFGLAQKKKMGEAGKVLDQAISQCPPNVYRVRQRAIFYALDNDLENAKRTTREAIALAEKLGDACEADLARQELDVFQGKPRPKALPPSCAEKSEKIRKRE